MGVLVGTGVCVAVEVGVAEQVRVGVSRGLVGKGMMVGSGGACWPQAARGMTRAIAHTTRMTRLLVFIYHLFVAQGINGVEARRSHRRVETKDHPHYQREGRGQENGLHGDHGGQICR